LRGIRIASDAGVPVRAEIVGPSSEEYRRHLLDRLEELDLANIVALKGALDSAGIADVYSSSHIGVVLYEDTDGANNSLPNKLFEIMAAGRCVLANQHEAKELIERERCGVGLRSLSPEELASAFADLAANRAYVAEAGRRGLAAAQRTYNWQTQVEPLVARVTDLLGSNVEGAPLAKLNGGRRGC
jgi:glycosyltransferase involved in cell wall biosynthesis